MFRTKVNEVNVESIDLGRELRQGVQFRLARAPIVICRPIARECLHRRKLYALRCIRDRFPFRPLRCVDAPAQFGKFRFLNIRTKRTNRALTIARLLCSFSHSFGPFCKNGKTWRPGARASPVRPASREAWFRRRWESISRRSANRLSAWRTPGAGALPASRRFGVVVPLVSEDGARGRANDRIVLDEENVVLE